MLIDYWKKLEEEYISICVVNEYDNEKAYETLHKIKNIRFIANIKKLFKNLEKIENESKLQLIEQTEKKKVELEAKEVESKVYR